MSETRSGFVQRQQVEIMGRIGAHWHRAKHVVVYERTVNPSAQFAPERDDQGAWKTRTRRPVLRKVSEFIEILQPVRRYPDREDAKPQSCGCLDSIRFNSRIIHVDSAWGADVGDTGYEIPLWNRHSASIRPQVYPKPDVAFVTIGEGKDDHPLLAQECLDPDNLYFYADASQSVNDTDQWPRVIGVDYVDAMDCTEIMRTLESSKQSDGQAPSSARKANVSRVLPGYRRFTWRLAPASTKTMINANRGANPIYVGLESITFMRGAVRDLPANDPQGDLLRLIGDIGETVGGTYQPAPIGQIKMVLNRIPHWEGPDDIPPEFAKEITTTNAKFLGSIHKFQTIPPSDLAAAKKELKNHLEDHLTKFDPKRLTDKVFEGDIKGSISKLNTKLSGNVAQLVNAAKSAQATRGSLAAQAVASVRRKKALILENVMAWQHEFKAEMQGWKVNESPFDGLPTPDTVKSRITLQIKDAIARQISPAFALASKDVSGLRTEIHRARAIALDTQEDLEQLLLRARGRLDALKASYNDAAPWSEGRLKSFEDRLASDLGGVENDIKTAIDDGQHRLNTELGLAAHQLGAIIGKVLAATVNYRSRAILKVETERVAIAQITALVRIRLESLTGTGEAQAKSVLAKFGWLLAMARARGAPEGVIKAIEPEINSVKVALESLEGPLKALEDKAISDLAGVKQAHATLAAAVQTASENLGKLANSIEDKVKDLTGTNFSDLIPGIISLSKQFDSEGLKDAVPNLDSLVGLAGLINPIIDGAVARVEAARSETRSVATDLFAVIDDQAFQVEEKLIRLEEDLGPKQLQGVLLENVIGPVVKASVNGISDELLKGVLAGNQGALDQYKTELSARVQELSTGIERALDKVDEKVIGLTDQTVKDLKALAGDLASIADAFTEPARTFEAQLQAIKVRYDGLRAEIESAADLDQLQLKLQGMAMTVTHQEQQLREIVNTAGALGESAKAYVDRIMESAVKFARGNLQSAASDVLRLYSAATSSPEIAMLEVNIDRIRCSFKAAENLIETTKATATFARLGDALKALGLELPFNGLDDHLHLDAEALKKFDLTRMFRNFGGLDLQGLFDGIKLPDPDNIGQFVRVSHEFDRQQARAWVQIDVDQPIQGRSTLFSYGPVAVFFRESRLAGQLRLEASKDADQVQQTGYSTIGTDIEVVVSGQAMVTLEQVRISYSAEAGLQFDFDPKNIKLNDAFRFVQDTLGSLLGDEVGGMTIIKESGIPIGVEHNFTMPPVSLMFGTSGISNIQISNKFRLLAYPDFAIANRFNLSTPELPFLFSIFIIGGTGYIQIDTHYRPFDRNLMVVVEAAAGGSAALGFSLGPISGSVFISFSVALSYRKLIGTGEGSGLAVSTVLVIAGNLSLFGIAYVYLGIVLRMTYRDNGQIDAEGTVAVEVRVCRFLTLKYRGTVNYKLRDGQSTTVTSSTSQVDVNDRRFQALRENAKRLEQVRR